MSKHAELSRMSELNHHWNIMEKQFWVNFSMDFVTARMVSVPLELGMLSTAVTTRAGAVVHDCVKRLSLLRMFTQIHGVDFAN